MGPFHVPYFPCFLDDRLRPAASADRPNSIRGRGPNRYIVVEPTQGALAERLTGWPIADVE